MRFLTAKYEGTCAECGDPIHVGASIGWERGYTAHQLCAQAATGTPEQRAAQAEYALGIADGRRYHQDKLIYGEALAERFALEDELARWNRGED